MNNTDIDWKPQEQHVFRHVTLMLFIFILTCMVRTPLSVPRRTLLMLSFLIHLCCYKFPPYFVVREALSLIHVRLLKQYSVGEFMDILHDKASNAINQSALSAIRIVEMLPNLNYVISVLLLIQVGSRTLERKERRGESPEPAAPPPPPPPAAHAAAAAAAALPYTSTFVVNGQHIGNCINTQALELHMK